MKISISMEEAREILWEKHFKKMAYDFGGLAENDNPIRIEEDDGGEPVFSVWVVMK